ncbi:hypothetical protein BH11MYX2_BH11MYX2_24600 [soil metagenome]
MLQGRITASCQDCHTATESDLKYFNFSNESIVARSQFHGLTRLEGQQIATYVRTTADRGSANGRPWNPPYQPGPGLDSRQVFEWAAGAGIDAVLTDTDTMTADARMDPYLFPGGHFRPAIRAVVDRFATLNFRETPVAIQMPDWAAWLPVMHPLDAFDATQAAVISDERGNLGTEPFVETLYKTAATTPTVANIDAMMRRALTWVARRGDCDSRAKPAIENDNGPRYSTGPEVRTVNGEVLSKLNLPNPPAVQVIAHPSNDIGLWDAKCTTLTKDVPTMTSVEIAKQGLLAWVAVKQWDLIHGQGLEGNAAMLPSIPVNERNVEVKEARGWPVPGRSVFDRAPHMSGHNSMQFEHLDLLASLYTTSAWYHLQTVLQPGYRKTMPAHFPYSILFVMNLSTTCRSGRSSAIWLRDGDDFRVRISGLRWISARCAVHLTRAAGSAGRRSYCCITETNAPLVSDVPRIGSPCVVTRKRGVQLRPACRHARFERCRRRPGWRHRRPHGHLR